MSARSFYVYILASRTTWSAASQSTNPNWSKASRRSTTSHGWSTSSSSTIPRMRSNERSGWRSGKDLGRL